MEKRKHSLVDNADEKRYEFDLGDDIAIIEYIKTQGFIILTHTEVPEKYEGQGIGAECQRIYDENAFEMASESIDRGTFPEHDGCPPDAALLGHLLQPSWSLRARSL